MASGFLGKGATARAYKLGSDVTKDKFDDGIEEVDKIILYCGNQAPVVIKTPDEITEIRNFINNQGGFIAKVFYDSKRTATESFYSEVKKTELVNGLYETKANIDNYLTTIPLKYKTHDIIGVRYYKGDKVLLNVLFNKICNNNFYKDKIDIIQFCKDILESLIILNGKGYRHNDIKIDNIVICDGKFKLIDWGLCSKLDDYYGDGRGGHFASTNPIKQRLGGLHDQTFLGINFIQNVFDNELDYLEKHRNRNFFGNKVIWDAGYGPIPGEELGKAITPAGYQLYRRTLELRRKEYNDLVREHYSNKPVLQRDKGIQYLKDKFRETFDVYMLGMCVLTLVVPGRCLIDINLWESRKQFVWLAKIFGAKFSKAVIRSPQDHHMRLASVYEQPDEAVKIVEKFTSLTEPMNPTKALEWIENTFQRCEMSDNDRVDAFDKSTEGVTEQTCYEKNGCWGSPKDGRNTKNNGEPIPWCYLKKINPVYSMYFDKKEEVEAFEIEELAKMYPLAREAILTPEGRHFIESEKPSYGVDDSRKTPKERFDLMKTIFPKLEVWVPFIKEMAKKYPLAYEAAYTSEGQKRLSKAPLPERFRSFMESLQQRYSGLDDRNVNDRVLYHKELFPELEAMLVEELAKAKKKGGTKKTASKARRSKRRLIATKTKKRR